eukprot:TRINITY_DN29768_c0_g2_i1.p5 TRINITY_DN29768_c0_g2~~TRINITY_DN29768_c0_g2_i1.p5  ORF type:complete len:106 (+),score=7.68 TRINITY_DN29768_c0_g2_i1:650-967(+)
MKFPQLLLSIEFIYECRKVGWVGDNMYALRFCIWFVVGAATTTNEMFKCWEVKFCSRFVMIVLGLIHVRDFVFVNRSIFNRAKKKKQKQIKNKKIKKNNEVLEWY